MMLKQYNPIKPLVITEHIIICFYMQHLEITFDSVFTDIKMVDSTLHGINEQVVVFTNV